ncbi:uncharacterized protein LOC122262825 [Penaeus japonicus]|uniref:uncharacterized protein LOC122258985 n=1 Tax=Penaeus japonicus TaxID=27405 RepID=UPI001C716002|nr:uncharacterized protein LOC122258985 [Penaeus japonicus]XP_042886925.1 uncharacterized protein LOC122262825 [Penaeus japonicus]
MTGLGSTLVVVAAALLYAEATSPPLTLVPVRPQSVTLDNTALFHLWNEQQEYQDSLPVERDTRSIGTLLSPDYIQVVNLTPQDAPNPLYVNRYAELRAGLLLDHMLQDAIDTNDPRMGSPNGLRAETFTGKTVVFRRDSLGNISVNNIPVSATETLSNGIVSYTLDGILFDYQQRVDDAFHEHIRDSPSPSIFGPF